MNIPSLKEVVSAEEWQTRVDLAACYRLVAMHGGTLSVKSEEGKGSAFTVRLPRGLGLPELEAAPRVQSP